jgi:hypothetical protein
MIFSLHFEILEYFPKAVLLGTQSQNERRLDTSAFSKKP